MSGTPLLQVENLGETQTVRGQKSPRTVFESVSFALEAGQSAAILGPVGAGKTRLARAVALIDRPSSGRVLLEGQDVTRAWGGRLRALRRSLQYVGGDPRRTLSPRLTVFDILTEPLQVHRLGSAAEQRARVEAAAEAWGLNRLLLGARPEALSAALCQRVALARAALLQPRVLVCDELVERLEPGAGRAVLATTAHACRAMHIAWLWTTSVPDLAREFSDRVLRLEGGRLVETA